MIEAEIHFYATLLRLSECKITKWVLTTYEVLNLGKKLLRKDLLSDLLS